MMLSKTCHAARPLFYGDDYRPGSRPSSSYALVEQRETDHQSARGSLASKSPSTSLLPPRPQPPKTDKKSKVRSACTDEAETLRTASSSSQLKLVHAPPMTDVEVVDPVELVDDYSDSGDETSGPNGFDPEASLALPSTVRE